MTAVATTAEAARRETFTTFFDGLTQAWRRRRRYAETRRALERLSDAELQDIGLMRADIDSAARRSAA